MVTSPIKRQNSLRELDTGAANTKTMALLVTLAFVIAAAAGAGAAFYTEVLKGNLPLLTHGHPAKHPAPSAGTQAPVTRGDEVEQAAKHPVQSAGTQALGTRGDEVEQDYDRQDCMGGSSAACKCILQCKVFGGRDDACDGADGHGTKKQLIDDLLRKSMHGHKDMCAGMRCIKDCARKLGCLDTTVRRDCKLVEQKYELHRRLPEPGCSMECDN
mmetsp:Transcript_51260/g.101819  ORF Transcript_51260/g.101819 Transcript_51260/m.101819 type:complete len:215 (-) Transcript_51260:71-715(-)